MSKFITLKSCRVRFGYTQADFGRMIDQSSSVYSQKESGHIKWYMKECAVLLEKINKHLEMNGETLLTMQDLFPIEDVKTVS